MSGAQIFMGLWAIASVAISAFAIWRVAKASGVTYKPLWIIGSLFGFVGFATSLSVPSDLYMDVGIQIPVIMILTFPGQITVLKAMFPLGAIAALVKCHSSSEPDPPVAA